MLQQVSPSHIDRAWRDGAHHLSEACDVSGGEITGDQLKMMLARGERTLLAGIEDGKPVGWVVIKVDQFPNLRVLHLCSMWAPGHLEEEFFNDLRSIATQEGCSEVRCCADPVRARLYRMRFGFEPVYQTLRVAI